MTPTAAATQGTAPPADTAIATRALTKRFGAHAAVDEVELEVPRGAVYGFLGPNGSGKTTTIRMLLGLILPSAGSAQVLGQTVTTGHNPVLHRVGCLVEGPGFHPHLSARDNLRRLDAVDAAADPRTSAQRIDAALERVGLQAAAKKRFRAYSLGMKQRLGLAAALLVPRELLVLDEPTNGLDPQGTREIRTLIAELAEAGSTVLVSSHLLSEVEQVCTHLGVMRNGRLVAPGTLSEIRDQGERTVRLETADTELAARVLTALGLDAPQVHGDLVLAPAGQLRPETVVADLVAAGVGVRAFAVTRPQLEDRFVELTGEGFDVSR